MNDEGNTTKSLMDELSDVSSLLDKALSKAKYLENNIVKSSSQSHNSVVSDSEEFDEEQTKVRPANWDDLKNRALSDSMSEMEEDSTEFSTDTKKFRQVKAKTKKLKSNDDWEDDPI